MAEDLKAQVVIEAQDRASEIINHIAGELGVFGDELTRLAGTAGVAGLAIAGIGAAIGGITITGVKLGEQAEQLEKLSTRTGVSAEKLQVLQQAIKEAGGDAGTLTTALTFLNRNIAQGDPLLDKLGLKGLDAGDAFLKLSDMFAHSSDAAKKAEIGISLMGRSSGELLGVMPKLVATVGDVGTSMEALGGILTDDVLVAALKVDEQADRLDRTWTSMVTHVKALTLPMAEAVVGAFNDIFAAMNPKLATRDDRLRQQMDTLNQGLEDAQQALDALVQRRTQRTQQGLPDILTPEIQAAAQKVMEWTEARKKAQDAMDAIDEVARRPRPEITLPKLTKTGDLSDFEKQVKSLMDTMGFSKAVAEDWARSLEYASRIKLGENLEKLKFGPQLLEDTKEFKNELLKLGPVFDGTAEELNALAAQHVLKDKADEAYKLRVQQGLVTKQQAELNDEFEKIQDLGFDSVTAALIAIQKQQDKIAAARKDLFKDVPQTPFDKVLAQATDMLQAANVIGDAYAAVAQGIQNGFSSAFQTIISGTATAASVITGFLKSIGDAIVQFLAQLAAAKIVSFIGGLLLGGFPFLGGGGGGGPFDIFGKVTTQQPGAGERLVATPPSMSLGAFQRAVISAVAASALTARQMTSIATLAAQTAVTATTQTQRRQEQLVAKVAEASQTQQPVPQNVSNITVLGYDNHSIVQDLTSPTGRLRAANTRVAFMGAY